MIEFSVLFLVRSNMNKMATASLHTSGSMVTNLFSQGGGREESNFLLLPKTFFLELTLENHLGPRRRR